MSETASDRDDAAARWAVLLAEQPEDAALAEEAAAWAAADPLRRGALLRAQATIALVERAHPLAGKIPLRRPLSRRLLLAGGLGSGAIAAGGAFLFLATGWTSFDTRVGEVRKVPLADGSVATVNTDSAVSAKLTDDRRLVQLSRGEAWFRVAHDAKRPFVVEAGEVRVRAVGTAFSVRRREKGADVLVTEGVVEAWIEGKPDTKVRLAAGSRALVGGDQPAQPELAPTEVANALAWREGQISLYGETLAAAASEFNRYSERKLVIEDPHLASEKVVGQFATDDVEGFARAAASSLGARTRTDGATIRLYR